jgi:hypothetical protein
MGRWSRRFRLLNWFYDYLLSICADIEVNCVSESKCVCERGWWNLSAESLCALRFSFQEITYRKRFNWNRYSCIYKWIRTTWNRF